MPDLLYCLNANDQISSVNEEWRSGYRVRTVREEIRAPIAALNPRLPRSETFVTICGWCKRVAAPPAGWLELDDAVTRLSLFAEPRPPQLTHGICEECSRSLYRTVGSEKAFSGRER